MGQFPKLDGIDRQILAVLQKDARIGNKELAATVGLAASSCHRRVQRLIEGGVLRAFHAIVDPAAVGLGLQVLVSVQLAQHGDQGITAFRDRLLAIPEVLELYQVGGSQDLILRVAVRDTDHLRVVVLDQIASRPEVRHLETSLIFEHRRAPSLPDLVRGDHAASSRRD